MQVDQSSDKEKSIKQLRLQLSQLTKELSKTTEQLQLLDLQDDKSSILLDNSPEEISELIRKQNKISHDIITVKKRIQKLSARTILKIELVVLPILVVLLFYAISDQFLITSDIPNDIKTRYTVENLQGQDDYGAKYWIITKGEPLTVDIVNPGDLNQEKISVIKDAILSTTPIYLNDSQTGKSSLEGKSEYYEGWEGALSSTINTEFPIPNRFNIVESATGPSQIVITLSHLEDPDGYKGSTRSIVSNSQILKSFITIYDADKLSDSQLSAVVRHEFGHALGLPHTLDSQDLMHDVIQTSNPYISQCDIGALQSLYDNQLPYGNCGVH